MQKIELVNVSSDHPDLALLISKLDQYLYSLYPSDEVFLVDFNDPHVNEIHFVIAYLSGVPVGCGAIKKIDDECTELKRFFVEKEFRNRGIAGLILGQLESEARNNHYKYIKLETGDQQLEAIGFYKKSRYYQIEQFVEYIDCPSSVCFEKKLLR
jgi:putative acetyltransferase